MADQAESLRRLVQDLESRHGRQVITSARPPERRRARLIAITGGKGGVGKSSVALNLGLALSRMGKRVLLVDADLGLASLDVMAGVQADCSLAEVALDDLPAGRAVIRLTRGLDLLPGSSGVAEMADLKPIQLDRLMSELTGLENNYDVVLIDTAAGAGEEVRSFLRAADRVLIVTNPEPTAVTDAYALAKLLAREGQKDLGLLVNMARSQHEGQVVGRRLAAVAAKFANARICQVGAVPFDWSVSTAVRERRPVLVSSPKCAASYALRQAADFVWRWSSPGNQESGRSGERGGLAGIMRKAMKA